jgi:tRNA (cmo5U34)-methyltransferase
MPLPLDKKSTVEQIRQHFDADVERFSQLETGQQTAMDATLILDMVGQAAAANLRPQGKLLDIGCGAGNFTLRVLGRISPLDCVLADLSQPMLDRARQRVSAANAGRVQTLQSDMRQLSFAPDSFDVILAGQTLHHLRDDDDWRKMFKRLHQWLQPGGMLFVADYTAFDDPAIQKLMMARYAGHLETLGGAALRDRVFAHCEVEDSPRSVKFQLDLLRQTGFQDYDLLHRNSVFAAFYARK